MKVIIAGSRSYSPSLADQLVVEAMKRCIEETGWYIGEVVCGEAQGIDKAGRRWGDRFAVPIASFPAKWERYGKRAGPIRNREMADYADVAVVIWDDNSPGSRNMIKTMKDLGKPVFVFDTFHQVFYYQDKDRVKHMKRTEENIEKT